MREFLSMTQQRILLASELFALSQGTSCSGNHICHWCGGPCDNKRLHEDPPPQPFIRTNYTCKKPSSPYECLACWLYKRKRVTVKFFKPGNILDRQTFSKYSWLITKDDFRVLGSEKEEKQRLYKFLLKPELLFCLSLISGNYSNLLHLGVINNHQEILADTELCFTLNSTLLTYTIYELEEGLKHGPEGRLPGVRALINLLGEYHLLPKEEIPKIRDRVGRPNKEEIPGPKRKVASR